MSLVKLWAHSFSGSIYAESCKIRHFVFQSKDGQLNPRRRGKKLDCENEGLTTMSPENLEEDPFITMFIVRFPLIGVMTRGGFGPVLGDWHPDAPAQMCATDDPRLREPRVGLGSKRFSSATDTRSITQDLVEDVAHDGMPNSRAYYGTSQNLGIAKRGPARGLVRLKRRRTPRCGKSLACGCAPDWTERRSGPHAAVA